MKLRLPSPSFVVAAVALSLAMGGVGYAAGSLPKNSVGSKQLKKNAVTATKIKPGAVTSDKIPDGSLTGADLASNSLGGAQIDESSLTIPSKPGSIVLSGYDFQPRGSAFTYATFGEGNIWATAAGLSWFVAPIQVPAGATVTGIKVFLVDDGASHINLAVGRYVPSAGTFTYSPELESSGASSTVRTFPLTPLPFVAGSAESLGVQLPSGTSYQLYGAQIDYQ